MTKQIKPTGKPLFDQTKEERIRHFLQTVPFLEFSDTGLANISRRFGITLEELKQRITEFERRQAR